MNELKPVTVGLIGVGHHAQTVHVPALHTVEELRWVACATSRKETAQLAADRFRVTGYADFRELLKRGDVEAVIDCTPWDRHEQIVRAALEAGKHVLVETPGIKNLDAARELAELARARKLVVQVAFLTRYSTAFDVLRSHLERVPPPRLFCYEYFPFLAHQFNLALYLSGSRVKTIVGAARSPAGSSATIQFENGDVATVIGRSLANCGVDIESVRVSAPSFYGAVEGRRRVRIIRDMKSTPVTDWDVAHSGGESYDPQPFSARFLELSGAAPQLRGFARAIRGGPPPRSTLEDSIETLELMSRIDSRS